MATDSIIIRGARQHNLKNIDVVIPRNRLVVVTGLSGSGKSTLAFDTLYAEGQRRYVESLSAYARQFLERLEKPDVDLIEGLSPAIAIEQKSAGHNPRSTVGTVTEIYDYMRLLFARVGTQHCHQCGQPIEAQTVDQMVDQILSLPEGAKLIIMAPLVTDQKGSHAGLLQRLRREGFARVRIDGEIKELESTGVLPKTKPHSIDVVVDRLIVKPTIGNRLADSLELALALSEGTLVVDLEGGETMILSENALCRSCAIAYPELTPASFSFNSPQGACPHCDGLGTVTEFEPKLILPNPELSLREGAVTVWAHRNTVHFMEFLEALTAHYQVDIYTPVKDLPERFVTVLLYGSGQEPITHYFEQNNRRHRFQKPFEGIIPNLMRRLKDSDSAKTKEDIRRYMSQRPCAACHGERLNPISRNVKIGGVGIGEFTAMAISQARRFILELTLDGQRSVIAHRIVKEIHERLKFLENVGLGYLTLARSAETLSGGEIQRIRLATQIGSKLSGVLYVLDEPSIGLHQRDNRRLLQTLAEMRDIGNSVLVVEHDADTILAADHVIDMGPAAGARGGEVVFSGPPAGLREVPQSLTGQYLYGVKSIEVPARRRRQQSNARLRVVAAVENNLKGIVVDFPLALFTCVTGVSGSGKSTLVLDTLFASLARRLNRSRISAGRCDGVEGIELVDKIINIDQSPIGRTPRSNPGTYTGLFAPIRDLFSKTPEARMRGYKPGRFSFNVKGGRCEACQGDGILKIEMHFLPDVYVTCDVCHGKRYNRETLEVKYKGRNIAEVLDMTVNQATRFFDRIEPIRSKLQTLADVGMGYVKLGQPATTLSGGEAQRIKLSRELSKRGTGRTVYILDEPTTGLHFEDIRKLLIVLNQLVDAGNTVIVIEHHLDVIKTADYIIDLGPEGGDGGGYLVACGTPEQIAATPASYTGQYLGKVLDSKEIGP